MSVPVNNLFAELPGQSAEEWTEILVRSQRTRIERIVSTGQTSPAGFWYDQEEDEWVAVLSGEAVLEFEADAKKVTLGKGDHVLIPAHCRHRVAWTSPGEPTVWLAVFLPPAQSVDQD